MSAEDLGKSKSHIEVEQTAPLNSAITWEFFFSSFSNTFYNFSGVQEVLVSAF